MKVSLLIITYHHEKYIQKALEGIAIQRDCPEFEVVLCDDCSSDNTLTIATTLLSGYPSVSIYKNENNLGITKNYQQAFAKCSGEYIFVLEGDDYWIDPFKIKKLCQFLDENPGCVMCSHYFIRQENDSSVFTPPVITSTEYYSLFDCKDLILESGIISNFSTCCYRKNILEKIPAKTFDTTSYDWMINMSVAQYGSLARINSPMSVYRISAAGVWANKTTKQQLVGMIGIVEEYNQILEYKYDEYFKKKKALLSEELAAIELQEKYKGKSRREISFKASLRSLAKKILMGGRKNKQDITPLNNNNVS